MSAQDHTDPARPWWATADPEVDRLDPDEDPLEVTISARQRAAERPEQGAGSAGTSARPTDAPADADVPGEPGVSGDAEEPEDAEVPDAAVRTEIDGQAVGDPCGSANPRETADRDTETDADEVEVCGVCPLCTGWRYLRQHHPDAAAHLVEAGRHVSDAHPDVVDHLAAAGRHLAAALRKVLDDRGATEEADGTEPDGSPRASADTGRRTERRDRFERIDLDDGQGQV